jgi:hypothetical protein
MNRIVSAIVFFGLLLGGVLLHPTDAVLGTVLLAVSVVPLLHVVLSGVVGGRSRDR